jgi:hypothetical protein
VITAAGAVHRDGGLRQAVLLQPVRVRRSRPVRFGVSLQCGDDLRPDRDRARKRLRGRVRLRRRTEHGSHRATERERTEEHSCIMFQSQSADAAGHI